MRPTRKSLTVVSVTIILLAYLGACGGNGLRSGAPDAGDAAATGGVTSPGGTQATGGGGGGGMGGMDTTAPGSAGGSAGVGWGPGDVNVHDCPAAYPSGLQRVCLCCDPLPAGSTEGCATPIQCGEGDTSLPIRYPVGCAIFFPWQNTTYYPNQLEAAMCCVGSDGIPRWQCLL